MRTILFLVCLFLLVFSKQKSAFACSSYSNPSSFSTNQHITKNIQLDFTNDNSTIILIEDTELEDEYQGYNELNKYQNNSISLKNHQLPLFWFLQKISLAALNCYNNFSKNNSLFSANSTPIYITIRVIKI